METSWEQRNTSRVPTPWLEEEQPKDPENLV